MEKYANIVQQHCKELRTKGLIKYQDADDDTADNPYLMVSNKHQLLACKAAGLAGTNIHRIMYALEHNIKDPNTITNAVATRQTSDLMLNSFGVKERLKNLKQYTKFMVIRDPLERLLSAYREEVPANLWSGPIRPAFRDYASKYLVAGHPMVAPWREVWRLCNPCEVKYDYIVPLSAFNTAIPDVLSSVRAPNVSIPTRERTNYKAISSFEQAKLTYNSNFPVQLKRKLQEKCSIDYYLFFGEKYSI